MNRFRKHILIAYNGFKGVRMIMREKANPIANYPPIIIYRIQLHKRFLGITYWETIVETTDYWTARTAYYLLTAKDENIGF